MTLSWIAEHPATWDADKRRIVGGASPGIFDSRYARIAEGSIVPGEWWRVDEDGHTVGYGWMDVNWGTPRSSSPPIPKRAATAWGPSSSRSSRTKRAPAA